MSTEGEKLIVRMLATILLKMGIAPEEVESPPGPTVALWREIEEFLKK